MNQNEEPTLEEALVSSIAKPNLTDLASELAEVGLDHFLTDGVLRDIPVLGTLVGLYRTVGVIREAQGGGGFVRVGRENQGMPEDQYWRVHPQR